jgi:outer membrane lipoprotein
MGRLLRMLLPLLLALVLGGWGAPEISRDANKVVDWSLDYARVKADPQRYAGRTLLLGGSIVQNLSGPGGTTLEILCYSLGRNDRPDRVDEKCGRFLARSERVLDPLGYQPGRLVTLIGTVLGRAIPPSKGPGVGPPLFRIDEIYLWPLPEEYPYPPYYGPCYEPYDYPYRPFPSPCW